MRRGMNLKLLSMAVTAVLGLVVTTISYSSSFLFSSSTQFEPRVEASLGDSKPADNVDEAKNSLLTVQNVQGPVSISHIFSPYVMNDEFRIVSTAWHLAAKQAAEKGIQVEHICGVLPEDLKACPSFARTIILEKRIENYRNKANSLPSYGEMFTVLRDKARGRIVMYSNADIAVVPDYYIKVDAMMNEDLTDPVFQRSKLEEARTKYFKRCKKMTSSSDERANTKAEVLCGRDAVVFFEHLGGRPPHDVQALLRFFKNASVSVEETMQNAYDPNIPDRRTSGNAMTITRRQFAKANATWVWKALYANDGSMKEDVLDKLFVQGEDHPGNDMFILPRNQIPRLLTETPFIHLRPSGFLIGQLLMDQPNLAWRRILSTANNKLTFHVGKGTDEWPVRAGLQPRAVLFEVAQYFTRLNATHDSFWPPHYCQDASNYRDYGTGQFCGKLPGDFCRGNVRLACTRYWHHGSRDRLAINTMCYQVSRGRSLESPFCEFCNVSSAPPARAIDED